ncbi:hypothetical protein DAPPUDRAFT_274432, partial [Daphnia pulex]
MTRILPKDCKRDLWGLILLSVAFLVVASLAIYAVVASKKNEPEPETSSPTLTPPPDTSLSPSTTHNPDTSPNSYTTPPPDTSSYPDTTSNPDTTSDPDTTPSPSTIPPTSTTHPLPPYEGPVAFHVYSRGSYTE